MIIWKNYCISMGVAKYKAHDMATPNRNATIMTQNNIR